MATPVLHGREGDCQCCWKDLLVQWRLALNQAWHGLSGAHCQSKSLGDSGQARLLATSVQDKSQLAKPVSPEQNRVFRYVLFIQGHVTSALCFKLPNNTCGTSMCVRSFLQTVLFRTGVRYDCLHPKWRTFSAERPQSNCLPM